ncbi:hypothetical protein TNCT_385101 [Trichonephila clavata]|uniref:Uncharacterized protein n=1 Tax=Trichonephila clavata TaxID=2740835 RepID=A0A8X6GXK3_TRICU|nr:hypothetical protein TNCT_385101 [Trichonephila clavata]
MDPCAESWVWSDQDDETSGSKNRGPSAHGLTRSPIQSNVALFVLQTLLRRLAEANMQSKCFFGTTFNTETSVRQKLPKHPIMVKRGI